jgi:predicted O-linked N-acetylglucosamine transferase (SPINDLY family)
MTTLQQLLSDAAEHAARGRNDQALANYRQVLALTPGNADVHHNIGVLLFGLGELAAAESQFATVLRLAPGHVPAALALGRTLFGQGKFAESEAAFARASGIAPDSIEALHNLAFARIRQQRLADAIEPLRRARIIAPGNEDVWHTLNCTLVALERVAEALDDFIAFEATAAPSARLIAAGLELCRLAPSPALEPKYVRLALDWSYGPTDVVLATVAVANLQYFDVSREALASIYRTYDTIFPRLAHVPLPARATSAPGKIRVGYLSADFRDHVMGRLMSEILVRHDRDRYEWWLYSMLPSALEDRYTRRFEGSADAFVRLADLSDAAAAARIAQDGLDVLVDLMGHSALSRPGILRLRPAPCLVTHLGYHGALGLDEVDFKITDGCADLPDAGAYQIERPLLLSTCVMPIRREPAAEAPPATRADLGIDDAAVVFGTFVGMSKLSPRCLDLWRRILERVDTGVLLFSPHRATDRALIVQRLAGFGIDAGRLRFIARPRDAAVDRARYHLVDVVLDTMPYTGGDTTAAALDMAVPVVTRVGERHAERVSFSLLSHLGVTETIAHSDETYVDIASRLAFDPGWRKAVAKQIEERLRSAAVTDMGAYAKALEAAYGEAMRLRALR